MGLLDSLREWFGGGSRVTCPACGTEGARQRSDSTISCKNQSCPNFDPRFAGRGTPTGTTVPTGGNFRPANLLLIQYRNFAGQERTFEAERESIERKRNHLVARVAPTGRKIALSRERIRNLSEVDQALPPKFRSGKPWPTHRERQVLGYHKKHGTTSPLLEKIRTKYPDW